MLKVSEVYEKQVNNGEDPANNLKFKSLTGSMVQKKDIKFNNMVPFYGYDFISSGGDGFVKATLTFDYNFAKNNHINLGGNVANIENKLFSSGNWFSAPDYTGYFVGYGLETFIGPLQTKIAYSPELNEASWYFSLGFWF